MLPLSLAPCQADQTPRLDQNKFGVAASLNCACATPGRAVLARSSLASPKNFRICFCDPDRCSYLWQSGGRTTVCIGDKPGPALKRTGRIMMQYGATFGFVGLAFTAVDCFTETVR
ncbi:hypothetical protein WJX84_004380, partial [Apatococcus fuscideae]